MTSVCALLATTLAAACGSAVAQTYPPPMNLTRYMAATASSVNTSWGGATKYAVDGLVCEESRWISADVNGPHWLIIDFDGSFQIGSANIIMGGGDAYAVANFSLQYWTGSAWADIPGATITGNTKTQRKIIFSSPVTTTQMRFYTSQNGWVAVKELAVFPPNGGVGYPIGTEIDIRSGMLPKITASSQNNSSQRPYLAYDGFVSDNSRWISSNVTNQHWLEYDFVTQRDVAYAHIYTGLGSGSAIANYTLQYWNAATTNWVDIPGGSVTGNTSTTNILTFISTIQTTRVRLLSDDDGNIRVKEMVFLPPNGGTGYPVGTGVTFGSPPPQKWSDFSDNFYNISNRVAGLNLRTAPDGTVTVQTGNSSFSQQYNILLNIGTDTYRLCNRANKHCLEVAGGSLSAGAVVQEGDYNARPYQQWRLVATNSYYELVNVYSGLLLTVNGSGSVAGSGLIQASRNSSFTQHWSLPLIDHFPKKGNTYANLSGDYVAKYNGSHYYNWGLDASTGVTSDNFQSMWWNNSASRTARLVLARPDWAVVDGPKYLIGYNEPNHSDQANMSLQDGLDEWSRMEQVKLPLVGPQHDYAWGSWFTSFFDQADAMGMRIDEGGGHIYPTASSVNFDAFINGVSDGYSAQNNRLQWVTEFNWVNWGGAATWTDDQLYSVLAETLWRYENHSSLKRYEWFAFSAYWVNGAPGAFEKDGNMLPLGRLYAGWDGDLTTHPNTWYIIHNRSTHVQLQNNAGALTNTTINTVDSTINWYLAPATSGRYYLVSSDGKRLNFDGTTLSLATAGTTGTTVEWALTPIQYGWYYLDHPATSTRLDSDATTGALGMYGNGNTWDTLRWRFVRPYQASTPAPGLLARYQFEGNTTDTSGYGNNATATGSPAYTVGPSGQAINLDGVTNVVTAAIGLTESPDITVATWIYWNGGSDWQRVFDFGNGTSSYMFLSPKAGGGGLRFAIKNGGTEQQLNAPVLPIGQWAHVAVTLNGDTGTLYTNGFVAATGPIIINPNEFKGSSHYIGKSQFAADPLLSGAIDDFRVYNYALSGIQIANLIQTPQPPGLVARYKFDGNTSDSSAYANHATATGDPAYTTGRKGQAISLDGATDVVTAPAGIATSADITIATWVYWNGGASWQRIFDFGSDTTNYMFLTPKSGANTLRFAITKTAGNGEQKLETTTLAIGQWVHVAVTLNGNTGKLYVNGTAVNTGTISLDPVEINPTLNYIGDSQFAADPLFGGAIDDFRVYNYALNGAQISGLMAATNPTNITASASNDTLTLSWPADHIGWTLLSQTNALGVGLTTNWFPVSGSSTTNQMQFSINPAHSSVFYQLIYSNAP